MSRTLFALILAATVATAASAQTGSNVVPPRAEGQVGGINQSIMTQQQNRAAAQQNQFETNSLRSQQPQPTVQPAVPYNPAPSGAVRR